MTSINKLKSFVGIKFRDGSNDMIPRLWITEEGSSIECAWPSPADGFPDLLTEIKALLKSPGSFTNLNICAR